MDRIMSTIKLKNDADDFFEGFAMVTNRSTKSYLEAALTKSTRAGRNAPLTWAGRIVANVHNVEAFHQRNFFVLTL